MSDGRYILVRENELKKPEPPQRFSVPPSGGSARAMVVKALNGLGSNPKPSAVRKAQTKRGKFKTSGRGATFDPRVSTVIDYGKKAYKMVLGIKNLINVEEKMFDTSASATSTWTGTVTNLSNVAQGNDYLNRDGNSILCQKLQLRGYVFGSSVSTEYVSAPVVRVMVLRDMLQTAGADPTPAQILEVTGTSYAPISPHVHFHDGNPAARRFRVLHDQTWAITPKSVVVNAGAAAVVGIDNHQFHWELGVNAHTTFQSTAGADASDYVGALYLLHISNIQTNGPTVQYYSRLYFTDN